MCKNTSMIVVVVTSVSTVCGLRAQGEMLPPSPNNSFSDEDQLLTIEVREQFLATFVDMFSNMDTYIIAPEENYQVDCDPEVDIFDKMAFLSDQPKDCLDFFLRFLDTQIFACFMDAHGFGHGLEHSGYSISHFKHLVSIRRESERVSIEVSGRWELDQPIRPECQLCLSHVALYTWVLQKRHILSCCACTYSVTSATVLHILSCCTCTYSTKGISGTQRCGIRV